MVAFNNNKSLVSIYCVKNWKSMIEFGSHIITFIKFNLRSLIETKYYELLRRIKSHHQTFQWHQYLIGTFAFYLSNNGRNWLCFSVTRFKHVGIFHIHLFPEHRDSLKSQ